MTGNNCPDNSCAIFYVGLCMIAAAYIIASVL